MSFLTTVVPWRLKRNSRTTFPGGFADVHPLPPAVLQCHLAVSSGCHLAHVVVRCIFDQIHLRYWCSGQLCAPLTTCKQICAITPLIGQKHFPPRAQTWVSTSLHHNHLTFMWGNDALGYNSISCNKVVKIQLFSGRFLIMFTMCPKQSQHWRSLSKWGIIVQKNNAREYDRGSVLSPCRQRFCCIQPWLQLTQCQHWSNFST